MTSNQEEILRLEIEKQRLEIEKQKISSRYNLAISIFGTFLVAVFGSYLTFAENTERNEHAFDGGHRDFVAKFVDIAIGEDIEKRQRLARYFAFVTLDSTQKDRWDKYATHLETLIDKNPNRIAELQDKLADAPSSDRAALEAQIEFLKKQLGSNRANVQTQNSSLCNKLYNNYPDRWLCIANGELNLGVAEIPGPGANQRILDYAEYTSLTELYTDDDIPWAGLFVAWVVGQSGAGQFTPPQPARNASWLKFGQSTKEPRPGDLVVFSAPPPRSGFVGFYMGDSGSDGDKIRVIGGNISNSVQIATFAKDRVIDFRTLPGPNASVVEPADHE